MTIDEFIASVPLTLAGFEARFRELAATDEEFSLTRDRPEHWWWRDVAAYLQVIEMDDKIKQARRHD